MDASKTQTIRLDVRAGLNSSHTIQPPRKYAPICAGQTASLYAAKVAKN
jgi:hypothetical protein